MGLRNLLHSSPLWLASVAIPLVMALLFAHWSYRQVEREAYAIATHTVDLLHEHLARAIEIQDTMVEAVQGRLEGMDWPAIAADSSLPRLLDRLNAIALHTNSICIVDPDGRLLHLAGVAYPGPRALANPDFVAMVRQAPPGTATIGGPIVGRGSGLTVIPYARHRIGPAGQPDGGFIWASFQQSALMNLFRDIRADPSDTVILVRGDGTILARYPPMPPSAGRSLPPGSPVVAAVGGSSASAVRLRATSPVDGVERIFAIRRQFGPNLAVAYGRATSGLLPAALHRSTPMLVLAAMSMALLLALTWRNRQSVRQSLAAERRISEEAEQRAAAERARADVEAMLRHLQRVQTLGHIAAGLVHDFRNTIQAIQAGTALIDRAIAQGNIARATEITTMLKEVSGRGADLTDRLLAFTTNRAAPNPTCAPATTITATCNIMRSALGMSFRLEDDCAPNLPPAVRAPQAELESALINLIINARDAMPEGGTIAVTARRAATAPGLPPGDYVHLAVADSGIGMNADTLARATDAFFTTKVSNGTGLGLTSIAAFVSGIGGTMRLDSTEGDGTTVTLHLPVPPDPPAQPVPAP